MKHALTDIPGIGTQTATILAEHGIVSVKKLLKGGTSELVRVPGFGDKRAAIVLKAAAELKGVKSKKNKKSDNPKKGKSEHKKNKKKKKKA